MSPHSLALIPKNATSALLGIVLAGGVGAAKKVSSLHVSLSAISGPFIGLIARSFAHFACLNT
jgi:hypothetical protein